MIINPRYFTLCLIFVCGFTLLATAQDRLGIIGSNYAGSQSVMINPSNILNSKLYMDINLVSFSASFQNNYLFIPKNNYSLGSLIREIDRNIDYSNEFGEWMPRDDMRFNEATYTHGNNISLFANATLVGPSAMFAINDQAFSFYSAFRNYASFHRIPFDLAEFAYNKFDLTSQNDIEYASKNYGGAAASWLELGFTYATILKKEYKKNLSVGITVKRLLSYGASFMDFKKMNYSIGLDLNENADASINESDLYFGYALPIDYPTNDYTGELTVLGRGWAFDFGLTYQVKEQGYKTNKNKRACEIEYEPYKLKIGLSILDVGKIKYTENAELHKYQNDSFSPITWESIDILKFRSFRLLSDELGEHYGNADTHLIASDFSIGLPVNISLQADYHYDRNIYFAGLVILPIRLYDYQLYRPSIIAFMPRYETQHFEVSTPISLYNFNELRLGASVRYSAFTVGTDKLGAFLGFSNFDGFDLYFMIKINFQRGRCANKFIETCN